MCAIPRGRYGHAESGDAITFGNGAHDRGPSPPGQAEPDLQRRLRLSPPVGIAQRSFLGVHSPKPDGVLRSGADV